MHSSIIAHVLSHFSLVRLFATLWTVACQAPLSVELSRQEYWSELPCHFPGDLPNPVIKPSSLTSPTLAGRFFTTRRRKWQPTLVFLPGESQGRRSLVGWSDLAAAAAAAAVPPGSPSSIITEVKWKLLSPIWLFATPWTIQSMEFSRPEYWSGLAFPFPKGSSQTRDQTQVTHIAGGFFTSWATGKPLLLGWCKISVLHCWTLPFDIGILNS